MSAIPQPETAPERAAPATKSRASIMVSGAALILAGAFVPAAFALLARWFVLAEICTHFRVIYFVMALVSLGLFGAVRNVSGAAASAVVIAWQAVGIVPWYLPLAAAHAAGPSLKVLTSNVNADTSNYAGLIDLVRREQPDVVFIQELSPEWSKALDALDAEYPYRVIAPSPRNEYFGLGLYSKYPLENVESDDPVSMDVPIVRADLALGNRRMHLIDVHLSPPEGGWLTTLRYKQYPWLAKHVSALRGPVLIAGDFNCTMWSPLYADLVREGRLTSARRGRGILPSWCAIEAWPHLIPIDQILGGGVEFTGAHLGTPFGSDHCPVVAELRLPE